MKKRILSRIWGVAIGCGILLGLAGATLWWEAEVKAEPSEYQGDLLGTQAPEWEVEHWMHSDPVQLNDLRGKVVLVRWWTGPGCPYCTASAPALNEFYRKYHDEGLEVFGFYHHKARRPLSVPWVKQYAEQELQFEFPVAVDPQWNTLREWWLDQGGRQWTSVTFLLDRDGVIRYIHPGGKYVKGDDDYPVLKERIQELLQQKDSGDRPEVTPQNTNEL